MNESDPDHVITTSGRLRDASRPLRWGYHSLL
jgi:hypothetical protein